MYHDCEAWRRYTEIEAGRIKKFLGLAPRPGVEGLRKALSLRFYANLNEVDIETGEHTLIYTVRDCRVQSARTRKGMPLHPCKSVGIIEYSGFAKVIDDRFSCRCLSCYPDVADNSCSCKWLFTLNEEQSL